MIKFLEKIKDQSSINSVGLILNDVKQKVVLYIPNPRLDTYRLSSIVIGRHKKYN